MNEVVHGIKYQKPKVYLFNQSGIGTAEFAGRTAYDSFDNSENEGISALNQILNGTSPNIDEIDVDATIPNYVRDMNGIESSELLDSLAWVHHHHSVIEHVNLSYLIKGTSRGVLQEHARHRIQSITVRSTRYTMSDTINAFVASKNFSNSEIGVNWFKDKMHTFDMFVTDDVDYNDILIMNIYDKLNLQYRKLGRDAFIETAVAKSSIPNANSIRQADRLFEALQNGKKKRNVGDAFKHIVDDNWKVDMVVTFNLRSLKNYFDLRDSGGAFFQIQWLAKAMKEVTPKKYLRLIDKKVRDENEHS